MNAIMHNDFNKEFLKYKNDHDEKIAQVIEEKRRGFRFGDTKANKIKAEY
jgi:hypothetical protein